MPISSQDVNVVNIPDIIVDSGNINVANFPAIQPVSGTVSVGNFPATQPISGAVSVSNFPATQNVAVTNTVNVVTAMAASSVVSQVVVPLNTNTTILASNASRKSAIIFIPATPIFLKFGATASATSFTYSITTTNTTVTVTGYTGIIDVFGKNQTITVTELI